jgi:hypothetical protein
VAENLTGPPTGDRLSREGGPYLAPLLSKPPWAILPCVQYSVLSANPRPSSSWAANSYTPWVMVTSSGRVTDKKTITVSHGVLWLAMTMMCDLDLAKIAPMVVLSVLLSLKRELPPTARHAQFLNTLREALTISEMGLLGPGSPVPLVTGLGWWGFSGSSVMCH